MAVSRKMVLEEPFSSLCALCAAGEGTARLPALTALPSALCGRRNEAFAAVVR